MAEDVLLIIVNITLSYLGRVVPKHCHKLVLDFIRYQKNQNVVCAKIWFVASLAQVPQQYAGIK